MFQGRIIEIIGFIDYEFIPISKEYSSDLESYYREEDEKLRKQRKEKSKKKAKEAEKDLY